MNDHNLKTIAYWQIASAGIILVGSLIMAIGLFNASMFVSYEAAQLSGATAGYLDDFQASIFPVAVGMIFASIPIIGFGVVFPMWMISRIKEEQKSSE